MGPLSDTFVVVVLKFVLLFATISFLIISNYVCVTLYIYIYIQIEFVKKGVFINLFLAQTKKTCLQIDLGQ